jgi:multiple sugar transport system permease protein
MELGSQRRNSRLIKVTLLIMAFWASFPLFWILRDVGNMIFAPIIYSQNGIFFTLLKNTSIFVGSALCISVICCVTAGFVLAVLDVPFRRFLLFTTLVTMLIPITALAMPLYVMIDAIGLNGNLLGLILASSFFPFGAFLSYLYFTSVLPQDLVSMGRIDGLGDFGIYRYLGIPLSKSLISVVTFFCFVSLWSSYHLPNILLADPSQSILSIGIDALFYGQEAALIAVVMVFPSVLLFLAANRTIARGIFSGAVKE